MDQEDKYNVIFREIINTPGLVNKLEENSPGLSDKLSAYLTHSWAPHSIGRRLIMATLAFIGLMGSIFTGNFLYLLFLIPLPIFSPRIVAWTARAAGRFTGNK